MPKMMLLKAMVTFLFATAAVFNVSPTTATQSRSEGTAPLIIVKYGDLWAWDGATAQLRQLTHHQYVFPPVLSPDSKYLAYLVAPYGNVKNGIGFGRALWLLDLTTGRDVQLSEQIELTLNAECPSCTPLDTYWISNLAWSADSQARFWISYRFHRDDTGYPHIADDTVWMLNLATGQRQRLTKPSAGPVEVGRSGLVVSPKENKLAWIKITERDWNSSTDSYDVIFQLVIHDWGTGSQVLRDLPPSFRDAAGLGGPILTLWEADGLGIFYDSPGYYAQVFIYDSQGNVLFSYNANAEDPPKGLPRGASADHLFGELRWYHYGTGAYFGSIMDSGGARTVLIDLPARGVKVIDQDVAAEYYSRRASDGYAIRRSFDGAFIVDNQGKALVTLPTDVFNPPDSDLHVNAPRWAIEPGGQHIAFTSGGMVNVWNSTSRAITVLDTFGATEQTQAWGLDGALVWGQIDNRLQLIDR
jgi:hypothetical protein